jgi:hypothetical protein
VDDLGKRLAALLKSLECSLTEDCRKALDAAIKQHPITVDAATAYVDKLEHCHDADSIPGHETECAVHAAASAWAAADLAAIMNEATALGQRIDALMAEVDSIEKSACGPDAELSKAYVRYAQAKWRLGVIYNGVGDCGGDFDEALVQRICELRADAAAKDQAKKDCDTELGDLKSVLEAKKQELAELTANSGIDDIIKVAGTACP